MYLAFTESSPISPRSAYHIPSHVSLQAAYAACVHLSWSIVFWRSIMMVHETTHLIVKDPTSTTFSFHYLHAIFIPLFAFYLATLSAFFPRSRSSPSSINHLRHCLRLDSRTWKTPRYFPKDLTSTSKRIDIASNAHRAHSDCMSGIISYCVDKDEMNSQTETFTSASPQSGCFQWQSVMFDGCWQLLG